MESGESIILFLYAGNIAIAIFGYLPQIYNLAISTGKSIAISLTSWTIWLYTWVIQFMYAWLVLADFNYVMFSSINILCHLTIIGLTTYNRFYRFKNK